MATAKPTRTAYSTVTAPREPCFFKRLFPFVMAEILLYSGFLDDRQMAVSVAGILLGDPPQEAGAHAAKRRQQRSADNSEAQTTAAQRRTAPRAATSSVQ
jgi:hypothetical protein